MRGVWLDRMETALIYALAGFLFWPNAVSSICLIALVGIAVLRYGRQVLPLRQQWLLLLPPLGILVAWMVHGFSSRGVQEIQLWATWIGALVYFRATPLRSRFVSALAILSLIQALVVLVVFTLGEASQGVGFSQFMRDEVGQRFGVHPTYISAVWLWAATWLLLVKAWPIRYRQLTIGVLVIMAMIFGGKMPFIAFVTVIGFIIMNSIQGWKKRLILGSVLLGFIALNILVNPGLRQRFDEFTRLKTDYTEGQWLNSTELRIGIWRCALSVAGENWISGVGTGNTRRYLEECYAEYEQVEFFETEFNSHNQYLHFWLTGGIASFLLFAGFMAWLFLQSIRRKDHVLLAFLIYASMLFLTENYFSRQAGMMFIALTLMHLYFGRQEVPLSEAKTISR